MSLEFKNEVSTANLSAVDIQKQDNDSKYNYKSKGSKLILGTAIISNPDHYVNIHMQYAAILKGCKNDCF